jgi:hypothetical protein
MKLEDFLAYIQNDEIPPEPPDGLTSGGWEFEGFLNDADTWMNYLSVRRECNERGMWAIVDKIWTRELAEWIGKRRVLEIMAGRGWLAKALAAYGVRIIATDSGEWDSQQQRGPALFNVLPLEASEAIRTFSNEAEVLLVSWPPYGDEAILRAAAAWGSTRPMIYIGENAGGCNAPKSFFNHFQPLPVLDLPLKSWYGIHDQVLVGYYRLTSNS